MAVLILGNLIVGTFMEDLPAPLKEVVVPLHISCGLLILSLTLVRIAWRLLHPPPSFPDYLAGWQKRAAHTAHLCLYTLMLAMPLTGWSIISAHPPRPGAGPKFFGIAHIPPIPPIARLDEAPQKAAHELFVQFHAAGGWLFGGLLLLHIGAALKHQFEGHPELTRMSIGRKRR
jgi:cytochrome b561